MKRKTSHLPIFWVKNVFLFLCLLSRFADVTASFCKLDQSHFYIKENNEFIETNKVYENVRIVSIENNVISVTDSSSNTIEISIPLNLDSYSKLICSELFTLSLFKWDSVQFHLESIKLCHSKSNLPVLYYCRKTSATPILLTFLPHVSLLQETQCDSNLNACQLNFYEIETNWLPYNLWVANQKVIPENNFYFDTLQYKIIKSKSLLLHLEDDAEVKKETEYYLEFAIVRI